MTTLLFELDEQIKLTTAIKKALTCINLQSATSELYMLMRT